MDTIEKYSLNTGMVSVNDTTSLREDLGMDEFCLIQLFLELESMGMYIDYRKASEISTVKELIDSIHYL